MSHYFSPRLMASMLVVVCVLSQVLRGSAQSISTEGTPAPASVYLPLVTHESQSGQQTAVEPPVASEAEMVYAAAYNAPGNWTVGGRLGIGTETPAGPLHLNTQFGPPPSGLPSTQNGLLLGVQSRAGYKWIQSYGGVLALNPVGNNVGIGTTNPFLKLRYSNVQAKGESASK